jgi:hypothetical protein
MAWYRPAGQEIYFSCPVMDLEPYEIEGDDIVLTLPSPVSSAPVLTSQTIGWVGGEQRKVEVWSSSPGVLLKVAGGSDFYIAPAGQGILRVESSKSDCQSDLLDREILLGPALVLALAQRETWCLHASAISFRGRVMAFLGESGQGKSTLAEYLDAAGGPNWKRLADDILPVTFESSVASVWPHFPQLKLSQESQPGPALAERLPLDQICVLVGADSARGPALKRLSARQALPALISHTAGTRMFNPSLLAGHFVFCAGLAGQVPVYALTYPHRREALPEVRKVLEDSFRPL